MTLATDLGIKRSADPIREIVRFCEKQIRKVLRDFPDCVTLSQLLEISASKLGTKFEEIHSNDALEEVRGRYLRQGQKAFASLHEELAANVLGVPSPSSTPFGSRKAFRSGCIAGIADACTLPEISHVPSQRTVVRTVSGNRSLKPSYEKKKNALSFYLSESAAEGPTEIILFFWWFRQTFLICKPVIGIQHAVSEVVEQSPAKGIRSRSGEYGNLTSGSAPELGSVV